MFKNIIKYLDNKFDIDQVMKIYYESSIELNRLAKTSDYRNSKALETHMSLNILPCISLYKVLQDNGFSKDDSKADY